MDEKINAHNERTQNVINSFYKYKIEFTTLSDECKKLREINTKLKNELKESQELEKSHRYHLITSREMIANLQETVSQLVYLKRDTKRLNDEIVSKDSIIDTLQKEKENVKELRSRQKEMENMHTDKINRIILEYEEKLVELQEKHSATHANNIEAYRKKVEVLEQKLKQKQFKDYLGQNLPQQESKAERPYSFEKNSIYKTPTAQFSTLKENKAAKQVCPVMYSDGKPKLPENRDPFNIIKKRKLFNVNDNNMS